MRNPIARSLRSASLQQQIIKDKRAILLAELAAEDAELIFDGGRSDEEGAPDEERPEDQVGSDGSDLVA